jgi:hypothetical protein
MVERLAKEQRKGNGNGKKQRCALVPYPVSVPACTVAARATTTLSLVVERTTTMLALRTILLLLLLSFASSNEEAPLTEEEKKKAIRMKTTGQLKKIFTELGIEYSSKMSKDDLKQLAFDSNALEKWWELHPEKRPKPKVDGFDAEDFLKRQMAGDFSNVHDPEKRRILENLKAQGINFAMAGGSDMPLEQLQALEKMMGNMKMNKEGDEDVKEDL